jgi:hypothetical protein
LNVKTVDYEGCSLVGLAGGLTKVRLNNVKQPDLKPFVKNIYTKISND